MFVFVNKGKKGMVAMTVGKELIRRRRKKGKKNYYMKKINSNVLKNYQFNKFSFFKFKRDTC